MSQRLELLTPAKINLFLRITGRRSDGYHELDSVFLPVTLFDRITLEAREAPGASSVAIRCNWTDIPLDDRNLAVRAAKLFMAEKGLRWSVSIDLEKHIPAGAGLGGGSADAGGLLRMMARLAGMEPAALAPMALRLGADVPYFLDPRPARVGGVGERISYLKDGCRLHLAIGVPPIAVPTAEIYRYLERRHWSGGGPAALAIGPQTGLITPELLVNDLEGVAVGRYPQIGEVKVLLQGLGALGALMSGSGGAVFAVFSSPTQAQSAATAAAARMPKARFFAVSVVQDA